MSLLIAFLIRLPQTVLMGMVKAYRLLLSPWLGSNCRFTPSCSVYSLQALHQHGAARGSYLTLCRLTRCQPWCEGGHDPVPPPTPASIFRRLLARAASLSSEKTPS